ncbi:MAG: class A beta-lactamase-related serine hydrolase [Flavobacteriales bacterium]|nr:class A beta-lactamase-related serine hydrolase [Flavobacteriales bacterium]
MMMHASPKFTFVLSAILLLGFSGCAQPPASTSADYVRALDTKVPAWLEEFVVPGAAIAIIDNGAIIVQKGYGFADAQKKIPVDGKTGFNIASISKTMTAWGVMKLVEQGKLDLDSPAEKYLTRWHLPPSEFNAKGVTIRRLLSHTAGLSLHGYPGFAPSDTLPTIEESLSGRTNGGGDVRLISEPGTEWRYSGGGYTLLQLIIEEVSGQRFADYMRTEVLEPLGMTHSSFVFDEKTRSTSSLEHNAFGEVIPFERFTAQAAAGLHTTIEDLARFALASIRVPEPGKEASPLLQASSLELMTTPAPTANGNYGLGYNVETIMNTTTFMVGHGGSNAGWKANFRVDRKSGNGFVVITNGASGDEVIDQAYCDWVLWKYGMPLGFRCRKSLLPQMIHAYQKDGVDAAIAAYRTVKDAETVEHGFSESEVNLFGYELLWKKNVQDAVAIFKLNAEENPTSFNAYDSYGEGLLALGDTAQGIANYKRSIELNPSNENGIGVLKNLGVDTDALIITVPMEHMQLLAGEYEAIDPPADKNGKWTIVIDVMDGLLRGTDGTYRYRLVPQGDDVFTNPDDGATLVFDAKDKSAITFEIFGKYTFRMVK